MNIGQIIVWIIIGGFAGAFAGRAMTRKREGFGRWINLLVGMVGAVVGGELFKLFRIDLGLGDFKVSFEDLIAAFLGSILVILIWRVLARSRARNSEKRSAS
ncbi:MAG: GlsB/YeaQ/YmgE family stress response membrane protein [Verrucomicrobia bacterium]|nr:GlsB/YeaQ/YmgE family stress response membrane protein [Verrucomicrobiota bacterium]MBV9671630.1 GlsB/YeaQ/YmgE family stress response membrane protein [Verrucomicrobiota bacterium]